MDINSHTCKRVFTVSNGVVMHDAVAAAKIPPEAWTNTIFPSLGAVPSDSVPWPKSLPETVEMWT